MDRSWAVRCMCYKSRWWWHILISIIIIAPDTQSVVNCLNLSAKSELRSYISFCLWFTSFFLIFIFIQFFYDCCSSMSSWSLHIYFQSNFSAIFLICSCFCSVRIILHSCICLNISCIYCLYLSVALHFEGIWSFRSVWNCTLSTKSIINCQLYILSHAIILLLFLKWFAIK